jgi:hypothetical protein
MKYILFYDVQFNSTQCHIIMFYEYTALTPYLIHHVLYQVRGFKEFMMKMYLNFVKYIRLPKWHGVNCVANALYCYVRLYTSPSQPCN